MSRPLHRQRNFGSRELRRAAAATALLLTSGLLVACSSGSSIPELTWYINPDVGGQAAIAKNCSNSQYTIHTEVLPQDSTQQRVQMSRRLAAHDPDIDLMSLDPPFTAEFANAGFLEPIPADVQAKLKQQSFAGAVDSATWDGQLVVFPFWSNTQVLWYRKSFAKKAGIDMTKPVTWDQLINVAAKNGGQIGVQANKYEGYSVWINALIAGAGGEILTNTHKGADATVDVNSPAGDDAAAIIDKLAHSKAAPPDLSVSNEGTAGSTFGSPAGSFMVNWTYIYHNYDKTAPDVAKDIGYTRYPESKPGEPSKPPYGGIGIGVSKYSDQANLGLKAAECLVSPKNQGVNAEITGNMPASAAGYEYPPLKKLYPPALLKLFQTSVDQAGPRSVTPYWSDVSSSLQNTWHPPLAVNQDTPKKSATFMEQVLQGGQLL